MMIMMWCDSVATTKRRLSRSPALGQRSPQTVQRTIRHLEAGQHHPPSSVGLDQLDRSTIFL